MISALISIVDKGITASSFVIPQVAYVGGVGENGAGEDAFLVVVIGGAKFYEQFGTIESANRVHAQFLDAIEKYWASKK